MSELTPEVLDEGDRLEQAATDAPWNVKTREQWKGGFDFFAPPTGGFHPGSVQYTFPVDLEEEDAVLIEWLRNHARALIDAAKERDLLEVENSTLKEDLRKYHNEDREILMRANDGRADAQRDRDRCEAELTREQQRADDLAKQVERLREALENIGCRCAYLSKPPCPRCAALAATAPTEKTS